MSMTAVSPDTVFCVLYSVAPAATGNAHGSAQKRWETYASDQRDALAQFAQQIESRYEPGRVTVWNVQRYP